MKNILAALRLACAAAALLACAGAWAGLPICSELRKACAANGTCGQCTIRVCKNHTCAVGCAENVYELTRKQECPANHPCFASIEGRNVSGGTPYWYTQIGGRGHAQDCTGKPATAPICVNDFLDLGKQSDSINCPTLEGVRACCGEEYAARTCAGKPALECNCYNCGRPK